MIIKIISKETNISINQIENTIELFDGGATIPFISRYRKEMTGSLDEVQITTIKEMYEKLIELNKRREFILESIEEQEKLTDELRSKIESSWDSNELEDLYLPYRKKRKTRAVVARERGLEPLATAMMLYAVRDVEGKAEEFLTDEVETIEDALQGARDIIAETVNEDSNVREIARRVFERDSFISSKVIKGKEEEGIKYKDYFDFEESIKRCPSHRLLAIRRGEKEGFLRVSLSPDPETIIEKISNIYIKGVGEVSEQIEMAIEDSYKRLLGPSIENEIAKVQREKAEEEAIRVFTSNLRQLLLSPPLGQKRVLAIDPGFRTGCKVVCLDEQGTLLHNETIYPHPPQNERKQAFKKVSSLVEMYNIESIAIGNGTASRETESFIRAMKFPHDVQVFVVSEDGASVYSASKTAREEFPDYDVTVRGAVSIGRRLMDPLAELVKIDPKSIGVGQYQHDVDQARLKTSLDQTVESVVNNVGVELNTASYHLLTYVSGLGPQLAKNIVAYRTENGPYRDRKSLLKVPRLGAKAYEQAAGFLRIREAKNPLDNSAVHPETYDVVNKMAKDLSCSVEDLIKDDTLRKRIRLENYVTDKVGMPTLKDIISELEKPGRDPRQIIKVFEFSPDVRSIEDLKEGMILPGIVTNITNFGAFVDVGVKQDGLVHISQLADKFVSDPNEVVVLHQHVKVKVVSVEIDRKRIQLSMRF